MSLCNAWLLPRALDIVMQQKEMRPYRERIGQAANGRTLDVGIGSGLSLAFYGGHTRQIVGIDPSAELLRFAQKRVRKVSIPVELLRGSAEAVPLPDQSVDTVVTTFTLCSVGDSGKAVSEMRRVLKPGGKLLFAEHGRAPETGVARWQDRLTPLWRRVAGNCHLNRKPDDLIQSAGFQIDALETRYLRGPRPMGFVEPRRVSFPEHRVVRSLIQRCPKSWLSMYGYRLMNEANWLARL